MTEIETHLSRNPNNRNIDTVFFIEQVGWSGLSSIGTLFTPLYIDIHLKN